MKVDKTVATAAAMAAVAIPLFIGVIGLSNHIETLKSEAAILRSELASMKARVDAHSFGDENPEPVELTDAEKAKGILHYFPLKPMDIELRIVPREKWENPRYAAYSTPWSHPCRIYIPAGWPVTFAPSRGSAVWATKDNGETLAHEILHCERGRWHPEWDEILAAKH